MKIMLISPPNTLNGNSSKEDSFENRITPLDLAIIGAVLEEKNHEVKILDALALGLNKNQILDEIEPFNPDFVCLTAFDRCRWAIDTASELAEYISGRTIGLIWSYDLGIMKKLLEQSAKIDFAIYGDPEYTLLEIAQGKPISKIKGVVYKKNKKLVVNPPRELIEDFDSLPLPARHLLDLKVYKRLPHELIKEPNFDVLTSRGCPYNCTFCLLNVVGGRVVRQRSPEKTMEELKMLKQKGAGQFHFHDLTFTLNRNWAMKLCDLMIHENLGLIWTCQTRTDKVDFELLKKMKQAGCHSILYGIESLDQKNLDLIKKGIKVEDIENAIRLTKKAGIEARCSLIIGLPGETKESVWKTINLLKKLNPAFIQIHTAMAFPETELYKNHEAYGRILKDKTNKKFDLSGHLFVPHAYKDENEILELQKKAYKSFYLRPLFALSKLFSIKNLSRNLRGINVFSKVIFR